LREAGVKVKDSKAGYYMYPDFSNFRDKLAKRSIFTAEEMCAAIFDDTRVSVGQMIYMKLNFNLFELFYPYKSED